MSDPRDSFPLLDELLAEQQRLATPVVVFSAEHERDSFPATAARHTSLIPLTAPGPGEQYAFQVDLDACTGCKSCVAACHSRNGLDETETWRDVGLLVSGAPQHPFTQTVTTACHHCADPACLNGCPVLAYEKDPLTGIVRHLDDQCIGCSYCVLKCPYDVPKFSSRLGIVRKCDMCHGRLAHGEAPACAEACPTHAIAIVTVSTTVSENKFLPAAPDPAYTRPTTRYVSRRGLPADVAAADAAALRPQPTHWPLVIMLTLMASAIGCSWIAALGPVVATNGTARFAQHVQLAAAGIGALGLVASVFHLGQPARAWRIFLGWRRSWLSREALLFGAWFGAALGAVAAPLLAPAAAVLGGLALACSVMIYVDTRRQFWRIGQTAPRFFGTALTLGIAIALVCGAPPALALALAAVTGLKLVIEANALEPLRGDRDSVSPARNTALLLAGRLSGLNLFRVICGLAGGIMMPLLLLTPTTGYIAPWAALALLVAGETAERVLFFRAVDAPKMPGMPA